MRNFSQVFNCWVFVIIFLSGIARATDEQNADNFIKNIHAARVQCWAKNYLTDHPNTSLIKCENAAVRAVAKNKFDSDHKAILEEFLSRRALFASELDEQKISFEEYDDYLSDAADHFEQKIFSLQCNEATTCSK